MNVWCLVWIVWTINDCLANKGELFHSSFSQLQLGLTLRFEFFSIFQTNEILQQSFRSLLFRPKSKSVKKWWEHALSTLLIRVVVFRLNGSKMVSNCQRMRSKYWMKCRSSPSIQSRLPIKAIILVSRKMITDRIRHRQHSNCPVNQT